jgi:hypothetical protein
MFLLALLNAMLLTSSMSFTELRKISVDSPSIPFLLPAQLGRLSITSRSEDPIERSKNACSFLMLALTTLAELLIQLELSTVASHPTSRKSATQEFLWGTLTWQSCDFLKELEAQLSTCLPVSHFGKLVFNSIMEPVTVLVAG